MPVQFLEKHNAIQYTGANSADILAAIGGGSSIVSETGGVLTVNAGAMTNFTIETDDWVWYQPGRIVEVFSPATFADRAQVVEGP